MEKNIKELETFVIESIRNYLRRGDIKNISEKTGISSNTYLSVMKNSSHRPEIVKSLYDKAIENKTSLLIMRDTLQEDNGAKNINDLTKIVNNLIRSYLKRGEVKEIAKEYNFKYTECTNILYGRYYKPEIIKVMYDRAIKNKLEYEKMLNALKTDIEP